MNDRALANQLEQFGLSEKEIKTYLTVLENGEAKASTIADDTGVSKRYVYSICEKLEQRGFVDVDDHVVPTKVRARHPDDVIELLAGRLDEIEPALKQRFSATASRPQRFDVIKSRITVIRRLREYVESAERELMLAVPAAALPELTDQLADACERGVLVLLLVSDVEGSIGIETEERSIASAVRTWDQGAPIMMAVDDQVGMASPGEMLTRSGGDDRAIAIVQDQIVPIIAGSFQANYWPFGEEVGVADPVDMPVTYGSFRHAVFQTTLHERADTAVEATVSARPVASDAEFSTLSGSVVDIRQGMIEPTTNRVPIEQSLTLATDEGTVTVGGPDSFLEDYEAREVTLESI